MANEKIYVVTQGNYSDYHIVAATLDRKIAEKIAAKFSTKRDECDIEEYDDAEVMLRTAWVVYFDRAGNAVDARECDCAYDYSCIGNVRESSSFYGAYHIWVSVAADDVESAIKIAAEKRAKYLAEKLDL